MREIQIKASRANGHGTCKVCRKHINTGETQLVFSGYQTASRIHIYCIYDLIDKFTNSEEFRRHGGQ
jgi:hypothetical protein